MLDTSAHADTVSCEARSSGMALFFLRGLPPPSPPHKRNKYFFARKSARKGHNGLVDNHGNGQGRPAWGVGRPWGWGPEKKGLRCDDYNTYLSSYKRRKRTKKNGAGDGVNLVHRSPVVPTERQPLTLILILHANTRAAAFKIVKINAGQSSRPRSSEKRQAPRNPRKKNAASEEVHTFFCVRFLREDQPTPAARTNPPNRLQANKPQSQRDPQNTPPLLRELLFHF